MMEKVYIIGGLRSYIGLYNGIYRHIPAELLGAEVIKALIKKYNVDEKSIDCIIAGNGVGAGGNIARLMMLEAGISEIVPAFTIDMQCCSGLESIATAYAKIASRQADLVIAGGFESSSTQPVRAYNENHQDCPIDKNNRVYTVAKFVPKIHRESIMLEAAEYTAKHEKIERVNLDQWALRSHQLAAKAQRENLLSDCIVSIFDGTKDEGIRPKMSAKLLNRMPVLLDNGQCTTAGNACLINDGASFVLLCSERYLKQQGLQAKAKIIDYTAIGIDALLSPKGAINSLDKLLKKTGFTINDLDAIEINEAFAVIDVMFERAYNSAIDKYNIFGGALAYGHPYGVSGSMILLHLMEALKQKKGRFGCCSIAGAGGLGTAMMIELI